MSRSTQLSVLLGLGLLFPAIAFSQVTDPRVQSSILASFAVSVVGFLATTWLIPIVAAKTLKRGIAGKDLNKKGTEAGDRPVPEAAGLAPGCIFLLCIICFQMLHVYDVHNVIDWLRGGLQGSLAREPIADGWLVDYNAALATIGFMLFLGFADDVLDVPWRVKLVLPLFASMPLLVAYSGGTGVALPKPLLAAFPALPPYLELGLLYKLYMVSLTIFCANSINILAGVNGLEAGQTFVIACAVLCHNLLALAANPAPAVRDGHLFSSYLMLPLAATTFGLLVHNWYPSRVFVGDTFTYFAGMTIAVAGILGHFSETLLLFLVPQIFNFLYSCPQIFKLIPCPRHRLPVFDPKTGLLRPKDTPDWNVVQLTLQLTGNTTECRLCVRILVFQALCCAAAFGIRWLLTGVYK